MTVTEKHELTLSFRSSDELWKFAKEHQDKIKITLVTDYKLCEWNYEPHAESEE
jgi:hypothetical protein